MVFDLEDELDGVARSSADTARSETEISVGTTNNNLNGVSRARNRSGSRRVGVRRIGRRPHITTKSDGIGNKRWRGGRGDGGSSVIGGPCGTGWVLSVSLELGANRKSGILEVGEGIGSSVSATVDSVDHATIRSRHVSFHPISTENKRILTLHNGYSGCC